jgi:probable HAF family extracellular repeat protein
MQLPRQFMQVLLGLAVVFIVEPLAAQRRYTVTDLGTLGGSFGSFTPNGGGGGGLNNSGQVVGGSFISGNSVYHAFLYTGGRMTDLGTLGGSYSIANGINNSGQVVGYSFDAGHEGHAFLYTGGTMTALGTLGGTASLAFGINNSGQVAGFANTTGNAGTHAFLYTGGRMTDLGTLGGSSSQGYGINSYGDVVGYSSTPGDAAFDAFLYSGGKMTGLGTLGGSIGRAYSINNSGQVVGDSLTPGDTTMHAFLYTGGRMTDLGTLGGSSSQGYGINSYGEVVGAADTSELGVHAFLYYSGIMHDLNSFLPANSGWVLEAATAINDAGQISGSGAYIAGPDYYNGQQHAFRLDPVDTTPPIIVPQITGTLGNIGWYRSAVTIKWNVSDPESGIAASTGCTPTTLTADTAGDTLTCSATNGAGLTTSVPITIKIDQTPPIISGLPAPGCTIWPPNHKLVQIATLTATDSLSGLVAGSFKVTGTSNNPASGQIVITAGTNKFDVQLGADKDLIYTLTATATDLAGNSITKQATCTVPHDQGH